MKKNNSVVYNSLLDLYLEQLNSKEFVMFDISQKDLLKRLRIDPQKYNINGKFQMSLFTGVCLNANIEKIKESKKIRSIFSKSKKNNEIVLTFALQRLEDYKEEKHSNNVKSEEAISQKQEVEAPQKEEKEEYKVHEMELETPPEEEKPLTDEEWIKESGLSGFKDIFPFKWLDNEASKKIVYCLSATSPEDSDYLKRSLISCLEESLIPGELIPSIRNLDEEFGLIATSFVQPNRVLIFVLRSQDECEIFNKLMGQYEEELYTKIVNETCSIIAITRDVVKHYRRILKKANTTIKWPGVKEEDFYESIIQALKEDGE